MKKKKRILLLMSLVVFIGACGYGGGETAAPESTDINVSTEIIEEDKDFEIDYIEEERCSWLSAINYFPRTAWAGDEYRYELKGDEASVILPFIHYIDGSSEYFVTSLCKGKASIDDLWLFEKLKFLEIKEREKPIVGVTNLFKGEKGHRLVAAASFYSSKDAYVFVNEEELPFIQIDYKYSDSMRLVDMPLNSIYHYYEEVFDIIRSENVDTYILFKEDVESLVSVPALSDESGKITAMTAQEAVDSFKDYKIVCQDEELVYVMNSAYADSLKVTLDAGETVSFAEAAGSGFISAQDLEQYKVDYYCFDKEVSPIFRVR